jgi:hypothetical protein
MSKKSVINPKRPAHPFWKIGAAYFVRTATYHQTGQLEAITDTEVVFIRAACIADSGRLAQAIAAVEFSEVEPFPPDRPVLVNRAAIIDAIAIPVDRLPTAQK